MCPCFCPWPRCGCLRSQRQVNTGVRCSAGDQKGPEAVLQCCGTEGWQCCWAVLSDPLRGFPAGLSPPGCCALQQVTASSSGLWPGGSGRADTVRGPQVLVRCTHQTLWVKAFALKMCTWHTFYP